MTLELNKSTGFQQMSHDELYEVNGGVIWKIIVAGVVVVVFGAGVVNGCNSVRN